MITHNKQNKLNNIMSIGVSEVSMGIELNTYFPDNTKSTQGISLY